MHAVVTMAVTVLPAVSTDNEDRGSNDDNSVQTTTSGEVDGDRDSDYEPYVVGLEI